MRVSRPRPVPVGLFSGFRVLVSGFGFKISGFGFCKMLVVLKSMTMTEGLTNAVNTSVTMCLLC